MQTSTTTQQRCWRGWGWLALVRDAARRGQYPVLCVKCASCCALTFHQLLLLCPVLRMGDSSVSWSASLSMHVHPRGRGRTCECQRALTRSTLVCCPFSPFTARTHSLDGTYHSQAGGVLRCLVWACLSRCLGSAFHNKACALFFWAVLSHAQHSGVFATTTAPPPYLTTCAAPRPAASAPLR